VAAAVGSVGSAGRRKPSKAERKKAKKLAKQARKAAEAARAPGPAPLRAHRGSSDPRPVATAPAEAEHPGPTAEPDREPRSQPVAEPGTGGSTTDPRSPAPDAHRDDLQVISGIGPVMERALNDLGIRSWEQLAAMDERAASRLSARLPGVPGRVEREGWVAQAVDLVARHPLTEPYDRPGRAPLTPARD
jgi:NADH-quinone oxidoreductase subunit E